MAAEFDVMYFFADNEGEIQLKQFLAEHDENRWDLVNIVAVPGVSGKEPVDAKARILVVWKKERS